jgi:hypothetical protein
MFEKPALYATHEPKPENQGRMKYSEPGREHSKLYLGLMYITKH